MSQQNQGRETTNPGQNPVPNKSGTGRPDVKPQYPNQPKQNPNKKDEKGDNNRDH